ncbi:MAG: hypothetical protein ACYC61_03375 [Isosphaeraceae bacterium]
MAIVEHLDGLKIRRRTTTDRAGPPAWVASDRPSAEHAIIGRSRMSARTE